MPATSSTNRSAAAVIAVYASASYALSVNSELEILSTDSDFGTAGIDLTGNELGNMIYGNAGDNLLNGDGGADVMVGLGGNDSYFVDNAADVVYESLGGGNDRVYSSHELRARGEQRGRGHVDRPQ